MAAAAPSPELVTEKLEILGLFAEYFGRELALDVWIDLVFVGCKTGTVLFKRPAPPCARCCHCSGPLELVKFVEATTGEISGRAFCVRSRAVPLHCRVAGCFDSISRWGR